jgi:molybdopterin biosynthesis enzyme
MGVCQNGEFEVYDNNKYNSGMLSPVAGSNSFIVTTDKTSVVKVGEELNVVMLASALSDEFHNFLK